MSTSQRLLRHEAELLRSFAEAYRGKFEQIIDRLNHVSAPGDDVGADHAACLRLCIETLGMLLTTQSHLAEALTALSQDQPLASAA